MADKGARQGAWLRRVQLCTQLYPFPYMRLPLRTFVKRVVYRRKAPTPRQRVRRGHVDSGRRYNSQHTRNRALSHGAHIISSYSFSYKRGKYAYLQKGINYTAHACGKHGRRRDLRTVQYATSCIYERKRAACRAARVGSSPSPPTRGGRLCGGACPRSSCLRNR